MKMYIAVLDQVPDFMVPTLVAHTVLAAHMKFVQSNYSNPDPLYPTYIDWLENSFSKVTLRVNQKEFDKIAAMDYTYLGHENTTLEGRKCCAIPLVCADEDRPNVLKYAKMWAPDNTALENELAAWKQVPDDLDCTSDVIYEDGKIVYVY
jgi:hypothetical protein